jgi:hypothetical protein
MHHFIDASRPQRPHTRAKLEGFDDGDHKLHEMQPRAACPTKLWQSRVIAEYVENGKNKATTGEHG